MNGDHTFRQWPVPDLLIKRCETTNGVKLNKINLKRVERVIPEQQNESLALKKGN